MAAKLRAPTARAEHRALGAGAPPRRLERREQVLRAAERLFARHGYDGVGLREIAREVGIQAPSLFKHFASKQALYNAVLGDLFAALAAPVRAAIHGAGGHAERLDRVVGAYVDFLVARPHFPAILFRETLDHPQAIEGGTAQRGLEIYRELEAFVRSGRRAGVFRAASPRHLIFGFTGMVTYFHAAQSEAFLLATNGRGRRSETERWRREVMRTMRLALLAPARPGGVAAAGPRPAPRKRT